MRRFIFPFFFCFLFFWTSANAQAGKVTPELQKTLQASHPDDEVSVIITLSDKADINPFKDKPKSLRRAGIIKALKSKADLTQRPLKAHLEGRGARKIKSLWLINGIAVTARGHVIEELAALPEVESIKPDGVINLPEVGIEAAAIPEEWNISAIRAPELWNLSITGSGVVVANLDTGVDVGHPDLGSRWRTGTNSWFNPYSDPANGAHCAIPFQCAPCESSTLPCDDDGHGTGTMGIMVGGDAGGTAIGVAPGAQWIAVKIFNNEGGASYSVIHQGFQWLLDPDGNPDTDDAPDVVNNSWGLNSINDCSPQAREFQPDIQTLKGAGIAVVFAAGNDGSGSSTSVSPANYPESFAVGATNLNDQIASFSSRGPSACDGTNFPHVVAPGVNVKVADVQLIPSPPALPAYRHLSGTSFAAPHVAGAMALLLSAIPTLTVSELEKALKQSAFDLGASGPDNNYGYGLIDAWAAYSLALNPAISAYPVSHQFGKVKEGLISLPQVVTVTNQGLKDLTVDVTSISGTDSSDFLILTDLCSGVAIVSTGSCAVQVVFKPTSGGSKSADLLISSNDPDQPLYPILLHAKGIERYNLGVTVLGTGAGSVISDLPGIHCAADGANCSRLFLPGTTATLQAVPDGDSGFGGWSGCSWSSGRTCQVIMGRDKTVTGAFIAPSLTLTSPNGGESLEAGTDTRVRWTYTGRPGPYVKIELLQGGTVRVIKNKAPRGSYGKGHFDWLVPKELPDGVDYKVRITDARIGTYADESEALFAIYH